MANFIPPPQEKHYISPAQAEANAYMAGGAGTLTWLDPALQFSPEDYLATAEQRAARDQFSSLYTQSGWIDPEQYAYEAAQLGGAPQVATNFTTAAPMSIDEVYAADLYAAGDVNAAAAYQAGALKTPAQYRAGSVDTPERYRAGAVGTLDAYQPTAVAYDGSNTTDALAAYNQALGRTGTTTDQATALALQRQSALGLGPSVAVQQQQQATSEAAAAFAASGSAASAQYRQAADLAARQQMSMAAGARGSMSGLALLNAQNNAQAGSYEASLQAGQAQQQADIQAARALESGGYAAAGLRAQEQIAAQGQYSDTASGVRAQTLAQANAYSDYTAQQAALDSQLYGADLTAEQARQAAYNEYAARNQQSTELGYSTAAQAAESYAARQMQASTLEYQTQTQAYEDWAARQQQNNALEYQTAAQSYESAAARQLQADTLEYQTQAQAYQDWSAQQLQAQQYNVSTGLDNYNAYADRVNQTQQLNASQMQANQQATMAYQQANQAATNTAAVNNQNSATAQAALKQQGMLAGASGAADQANTQAAQYLSGIEAQNESLSHRADRIANWDAGVSTTAMQSGTQAYLAGQARDDANTNAAIAGGATVLAAAVAASDERVKNVYGQAPPADFRGTRDYSYRYNAAAEGMPGVDSASHIGPMAQDLPRDVVITDAAGREMVDTTRLALRSAAAIGALQRRQGKR
jgi:hypothetical protein